MKGKVFTEYDSARERADRARLSKYCCFSGDPVASLAIACDDELDRLVDGARVLSTQVERYTNQSQIMRTELTNRIGTDIQAVTMMLNTRIDNELERQAREHERQQLQLQEQLTQLRLEQQRNAGILNDGGLGIAFLFMGLIGYRETSEENLTLQTLGVLIAVLGLYIVVNRAGYYISSFSGASGRFFDAVSGGLGDGLRKHGIAFLRGEIHPGAAQVDANVHPGAARVDANVHPGAARVDANANVHPGAARVDANVHPGAARVDANVHPGATRVDANIHPGAARVDANVHPGAARVDANVDANVHPGAARVDTDASFFRCRLM